jgi:putative N6-adenine-specific DNA methylase
MDKFFAVCAPGLEPFLAQEIEQLGLHSSTVNRRAERAKGDQSPSASRVYPALPFPPDDESSRGGIEFAGSLRDLYRANLWLRTANRILVRLGEFYAAAFPELRRKAGNLPWERYLAPGQPVALRVTCKKSRLYHSGAVAERMAGAIADRLGQPPPVAKFDEDADADLPQLIVVRLANDHCTLSVDSSGALLHRRGYRLATARAPLRETLAAGMLIASGWDVTSPLLDPFCGSGTIPIEAAMMARGIAPGHARRFACMDWPNFDTVMWHRLLAESSPLPSKTGEGVGARILASDRDAGAIESAIANAERAGVADCIEFSRRAVSAIEPPGGVGWVVTNPPYGVRVSSGKDLRNLYARFGNAMCARCPGWHIAMLCDRDQLIRNTGLPFDVSQSIALVNGGLKVKLHTCQV